MGQYYSLTEYEQPHVEDYIPIVRQTLKQKFVKHSHGIRHRKVKQTLSNRFNALSIAKQNEDLLGKTNPIGSTPVKQLDILIGSTLPADPVKSLTTSSADQAQKITLRFRSCNGYLFTFPESITASELSQINVKLSLHLCKNHPVDKSLDNMSLLELTNVLTSISLGHLPICNLTNKKDVCRCITNIVLY